MTVALTPTERARTQALLETLRPSLMLAIRQFHISAQRQAVTVTRARRPRGEAPCCVGGFEILQGMAQFNHGEDTSRKVAA